MAGVTVGDGLSSKTAKPEESTGAGMAGSSSQKTAKGAAWDCKTGVFLLSSNMANDENGLLSEGA